MLGEWANKKLRFSEADGLLAEMDRLEISKALVFHSITWQDDINSGNTAVVNAVKGHTDRLVPVMALTPLIEEEFGGRQAVIDFIRNNHIGAVRLFPMDHNFTFDLWSVDRLFSVLDELNMLVLIEGRGLSGSIDTYYSQLYELAREYKNIDFVFLTVGYRNLRTIYGLFDKCTNIHIDTSTFITFRGIEDTVRHYGSERILFGSRMPFLEAGVSVGRLVYSGLKPADKENIAYRNAQRLLGRNKSGFSLQGGV